MAEIKILTEELPEEEIRNLVKAIRNVVFDEPFNRYNITVIGPPICCSVCGRQLWLAGDSMMGGDYWTHGSAELLDLDNHIPEEFQRVSVKKEI